MPRTPSSSVGKQTSVSRLDAEKLLQDALKQPGVQTVLDIINDAEKYSSVTKGYEDYVAWERFPVSCNLSDTAATAHNAHVG